MVTPDAFRQLALSLPEAEEQPHFKRPSFRIRKKIFATLHPVQQRAVLKLTQVDQSVFCGYDAAIFYPVPGGWGKQGYTFVELAAVPAELLHDALVTAWRTVAPAKLAGQHPEL